MAQAGKKHSKHLNRRSLPARAGSKQLTQVQAPPYTTEQLAEIGRRSLAMMRGDGDDVARQRQEQEKQRRAEIERIEREGITLKGRRLDHAQNLVDAMNISALAIHDLAKSACCTSDPREAGSYLSGIENCAVLICRRADALADYLGAPAFGNFRDDIQALTPERAAELDRLQTERDHQAA